MLEETRIILSIIVRIVGGDSFIQRCLSHLSPQTENRLIEVIVPYDSTLAIQDDLVEEFPAVQFINLGKICTNALHGTLAAAHELCDRRTAKGLRVARGNVIALLEDYATPEPDWCNQILEAHKLPYGVIGGAVEHNGCGVLNWAVYFLDFGRYQLPLSEGPAVYLTDLNVSYKRAALDSVKEVWEQEYNEVAVHWALTKKGAVLWRRPQIVVYQNRGFLSFSRQLRERFAWGNLFAAVRVREMTLPSRLLYVVLSPAIPLLLAARMAKKVFVTGRNRWRFVLSLPVFVSLGSVWCVGELFAYLSGRAYFQGSQS